MARRAALLRIRLDAKDVFKARARELIGPEPDKKREAAWIMKLVRICWGTLEGPLQRRYEANNPLPAGELRQRAAAQMGVDLQAHRWVS